MSAPFQSRLPGWCTVAAAVEAAVVWAALFGISPVRPSLSMASVTRWSG